MSIDCWRMRWMREPMEPGAIEGASVPSPGATNIDLGAIDE